ncbi:hypothetical protein PAALTS15_28776 [Paenibacillus alvei TS-15]|uniref:Uncharacterized protein n=1 Tax=Paenibacillus alvei TS-15 TaxID=1117108 RepID=S9TZR7_PAEAL|nr:hypothetical protein [Paenibacillus alvei]EPY03815.1 hypothetical protein PAALTS15_28776 [Paenibacillus alvei TS-15]
MISFVTRSMIFLLLLTYFSVSSMIVHADYKAPSAEMNISVRTSPSATYEHKMVLKNKEALRLYQDGKEEQTEHRPVLSDIYVTITKNNRTKNFRMEQSGSLWNEAESTRLILTPKATKQLLIHANFLRKHHYGTIIPWGEAKALLPRKSTFSIIDLEKGLKFRVQRRAGSRHADVQPLTKEDTKTMKQVYDEHWSWNRKAIVVVTDDNRKIAASMNGMPHGGDGIPDNGFSGHFCVHFLGSSTHRSVHPDLLHQVMVYTAAGKREAFLHGLSPELLSEVFIGALSQRDNNLLIAVSEGAHSETVNYFLKQMENGTTYRMMKRKEFPDTDNGHRLTTVLELPVFMKQKNMSEKGVAIRFEFARESVFSPWKIRNVSPRQK